MREERPEKVTPQQIAEASAALDAAVVDWKERDTEERIARSNASDARNRMAKARKQLDDLVEQFKAGLPRESA